jgi:DsbC/DsbD-like thiol-disulfide interchange protein/cytochrome c biogenesis protein CcdA
MPLAMRFFVAFAAILVAALASPADAQLLGPRRVETSLHASRAAVAPGESFTVVLRQRILEGWHTYWRNPGAAGEPTDINWTLPPGFEAGPIQWPAPEHVSLLGLVNYAYEDEVLLPVEMRASASARPGDIAQFTADIYLVVCSEDTCVPEPSTASFSLPIAAQGRDDPEWTPRIAELLANLPRLDDSLTAHITAGEPATLSVALPGAREPYFFPFNRDAVDYGEDQRASGGAEGFSIALPPGVEPPGEEPLEGLLTFIDAGGAPRAVEITAAPGPVLPGTSGVEYATTATLDAASLFTAIALAFLGGLILNIMPCVLPVLSVKALSLAGGAQAGQVRRHGFLYFAGVMATFLALALVLLALRGAGEAVGWGFQLQAPWVTSALALLFFVIGLNLLGVFNIGGGTQNVGAGLAARGGDAGALFTGVLAVIAATPCTAPFMAGAIGVAVTQSAATMLAIFAALGLGFALPLTLLHFAPGLQRLIPKPGAWMERAKQVLAFPMFAAAIWLAWVLAEQTGAVGVQSLLNVAAALAFLLFVGKWGRVWLVIGALVLVGALALSWRPILGVERESALVSEPWSPARVAELRSEGRGVFVNFTAAWCITCKANELAALSSPRVIQAFETENVAYLVADWTNRDETIAAALAEHGRAGVPLYLYYSSQSEPIILPQILSEALILETIEGEAQ